MPQTGSAVVRVVYILRLYSSSRVVSYYTAGATAEAAGGEAAAEAVGVLHA